MGSYNDKLKLSHCKIRTDQTQIFHHVCEVNKTVSRGLQYNEYQFS